MWLAKDIVHAVKLQTRGMTAERLQPQTRRQCEPSQRQQQSSARTWVAEESLSSDRGPEETVWKSNTGINSAVTLVTQPFVTVHHRFPLKTDCA